MNERFLESFPGIVGSRLFKSRFLGVGWPAMGEKLNFYMGIDREKSLKSILKCKS